ncbi:MAG: PD-(D/E)XK nuclease family protein [Rickettsiaceae bacterium]|nr:PD-(D/E)XK nuclease family protein [Rickettsiaceae bacterium]
MQIYQTSTKESFLQEIVDFVGEHYSRDLSKLKIILPSALLCSELEKTFITNFQTSLLPTIIPFNGLMAESEEVFQIPSQQIGCISKLEEKITLAATIHSYTKLGYNLAQSLRLAPSLANLFFEFETNNIDFAKLENLPTLDQAEHWHTIYDFLCYASCNWQEKIESLHKMTRASYQKLIFDAEINRLRNNQDEYLLFAGVTGDNLISNNFIQESLDLKNVELILPPADIDLNLKLSPEDALYQIYQLLNLLQAQPNPIKLGIPNYSILDKLVSSSSSNSLENKIDYIEFDNIFHEAEYIALQCLKTPDKKIAIIVHNGQSKEQYCNFLDKYNLEHHDLWGKNLLQQPAISLALLVAEHLCCEFSTKSLFAILSHPLINSPHSQELKNLVRAKNRLASSITSISELIEQHASNELKDYYQQISPIFTDRIKSKKFSGIFKQIIKNIELLLPSIWQSCPAVAASLTEINQSNWQLTLNDITEFPEIFKQLCEGGRIIETKSASNITICRAHEATFINYDLMIISDLNEGIYPSSTISSPWLNTQMQKELGMDKNLMNLGNTLYDFYLNLHNKNIVLTRSKRQGSSKQLSPSPFILHLMHILGSKLNVLSARPHSDQDVQQTNSNIYAKSNEFPKQLSATDIEMLIRAPYNFYAKKILHLKKIEEIDERPNLAEFGNFFHLVAEQYTQTYKKHNLHKELKFIELASNILVTLEIPSSSKKAWLTKITAIAPEFILFDEARRENAIHVYSELKGKLKLNICNQEITLIAIADRIDINQDHVATILDYKTGAAPSKKDVLSGLSPQLLVEAIILAENGFAINSSKVCTLSYVKINSSQPYISTTDIAITQEDIDLHKQGLINLLEHYVQNKHFIIESNLMKYDNYSHLARRN